MSSERYLISPKLPHIFYGGDYNPEQWSEEIWQEDVRLMQEAGVNLVSLGIFSWSKIEPRPDCYDFGWLDRIMDLLYQHNVMVDLATATASPPPWLAKQYPETLPVSRDGVKLWPGSRQQFCPSSPIYRARAQKLVTAIAHRYKDHPALALWHINNEYGCHIPYCYCDVSAAAFRKWLKARYSTIEKLNEVWGTAFWSQQYSEWDEIYPPRRAPTFTNPTQQLDFKRFSSDELLACFEVESEVLREITPTIAVTTNFMGFFKPLDYWKWASKEDVVSNDAYPDPADPGSKIDAAMSYDLMRSLGLGKPWLLMEQVTSQVQWRPHNALKAPGQMRTGSYQALARGANGIMFFQWRASRAGAEKFHGGMVPHVGTESSRVWREVVQLGQELRQLDTLLDSRVKAEVAIIFDWDNWWALELDAHPSSSIKQLAQLKSYYEPLYQQNITVDFVTPEADLSGYKVVLVPNLYLTRDNVAENLERFAEGGGTVVMSFFSGIVDENDHIRLGGYPAPFRKLLGLRVEELAPFQPGEAVELESVGGDYNAALWTDVLDVEGAESFASYKSGIYTGRPAITLNQFGQGFSYYLGTQPDPAFMTYFLAKVCQEAGIQPALSAPDGVEVVARKTAQQTFTIVLNHNPTAVKLKLDKAYPDLLSSNQHGTSLELAPYGVAILVQ